MATPLKAIVWGLPLALSEIVSLPVTVPVAFGAKLTLMLHVPPTFRFVPQLLVCVKLAVMDIEMLASAATPVFVSVIDWAALLVPTV
jgi:hypothetical protein